MKKQRQKAILDIVAEGSVETQDQLLEGLRDRGISATQATISRDIRELGLVKRRTEAGSYCYAVHETPQRGELTRLQTVLREGLVGLDYVNNLMVLKTVSGLAGGVAAAVDAMDLPDLVGCLAGDDTVVLILRSNEAAQALREALLPLLPQ